MKHIWQSDAGPQGQRTEIYRTDDDKSKAAFFKVDKGGDGSRTKDSVTEITKGEAVEIINAMMGKNVAWGHRTEIMKEIL